MAIRLGVIGCGGIAHAHGNSYKLLGDRVEFVACCDIVEEKAKKYAEEYGCKAYYTDCYTMFKEQKLDAVSVCTWNSAHSECSIAALNAGCHVFCEKPMAMNTEEALAMKEAAEKNNKLLMIGFVRRHGDDAKMARTLIENGELGEVYYAKATYLRRCGFPGGWFGDKSRSGGGPLIDLGVHVIDLTRYMMGNPKPVTVFGATFDKIGARSEVLLGADAWKSMTEAEKPIFTVEDLATAMIRFDNGAVLHVEASFNLNLKENLGDVSLYGSKAGYDLNSSELYTVINNQLADIKMRGENNFHFDRDFGREAKNFIDSIEGKAELLANGDDGVELMRILDAIYESAETGKSVDIVR
ncbi:MAG: Gfo/Idh/MocA family oxidoreductase [Clostridia bacterium]|nr:Gfo/Idh/MocA family oxidoreductase [Clostridia bacterium]